MSRVDRWIRLVSLFSRRALEREVDEELDFHIESRAREFEAQGMDRESARRAAERRFGDLTTIRENAFEIESACVKRQRWPVIISHRHQLQPQWVEKLTVRFQDVAFV